MLKIQIDNPELEKSIKQTYGHDTKSIAATIMHNHGHPLIRLPYPVDLIVGYWI